MWLMIILALLIDDLRPHDSGFIPSYFWLKNTYISSNLISTLNYAMHDMRFALTKTRLNFYSVESPRQISLVVHPFDAE